MKIILKEIFTGRENLDVLIIFFLFPRYIIHATVKGNNNAPNAWDAIITIIGLA